MPAMPLDVGDAIELAELLQFLSGWLESDRENPHRLPGPVRRQPALRAKSSLHEDFARFRFLLGVTDGEGLFTPDEP